MTKCKLIPFSTEEMRCTKCGYITFSDDNKTSDEIMNQMIKDGYYKSKCDS